uniref:Subtilisin-like protease n=1 Tax=Daucus carota subsp. sativus TaxID=79200 RepID=A0A166HX94_DAUCS
MASFSTTSSLLHHLILVLILVPLAFSDQTHKSYIFRVDYDAKPSIFPTHFHWYTSEFTDPTRILHTYDTVFHGFSASLTPSQAARTLQHPSVLASFEDRRRQLHTTRSPQFLGLRNQRGLWSESDYGSDVIIGVFDTGIWPERRSFSDLNIGPVPKNWKGICQVGVKFSAKNCNKKIIGARFFSKGHEANEGFGGLGGGINDTIEYKSPRDADGHGTHTASTAAGRYAFKASFEGYAAGIAKGVAPKARLAVYKVCWKSSGCFDSDILAAFDAAVNDGVNVISISIGGGDGISSPYYLDPIAIGSFGAVSRGVFVSSSAGNDGPNGMSVTNVAPWIMTVGAGTIDRNFPADVILGDGRKISGVSLYSGLPITGKMYPLVYPGKSGVLSASLCMENSLDPSEVKGKIVICDRGNNPRVAKGLVVKKAGGIGMILANGISNGEGLVGDAHLLPACAVGSDEGDFIKGYTSAAVLPTASISFGGTIIGIKPAPVVASFSGRGPSGMNPEILKPDIIAPGVNILASWTDVVGPTGLDSDTRKTDDYVSFLCAIGYGPKTIQVITRSPVNCPMKKPMAENLNYPSIAASFSSSSMGVASKTLMRTVTNVGDANAVYKVKVDAPKGTTVVVKPGKLVFTERIRKLNYFVTVKVVRKNIVMGDAGALFGSLSWMDGKHVVRSPIVVTQIDPL